MRLVIVGAGGFGCETAAAVSASGPEWDLVGYADDAACPLGREFEGARVLGAIEAVVAAHPRARVVVCTGRPSRLPQPSRDRPTTPRPPDRSLRHDRPPGSVDGCQRVRRSRDGGVGRSGRDGAVPRRQPRRGDARRDDHARRSDRRLRHVGVRRSLGRRGDRRAGRGPRRRRRLVREGLTVGAGRSSAWARSSPAMSRAARCGLGVPACRLR